MIAGLAGLALVLLVLHAIGSTMARLVGTFLIFFSLIYMSNGSNQPSAGWYLLAGIGLWLFGHWLWAFKHKSWRTALAQRVFALPVLHSFAPIESRQSRPVPADRSATNWSY